MTSFFCGRTFAGKNGLAKVDSNFGNSFNSNEKLNFSSILVSIGRYRIYRKIKIQIRVKIFCFVLNHSKIPNFAKHSGACALEQ